MYNVDDKCATWRKTAYTFNLSETALLSIIFLLPTITCTDCNAHFLQACSKAVLLLWIFFFVICASCPTVVSVPCGPVVTCWERADLLALLYEIFSCVFATFPYGVLCQVWYLIVWIPDMCLLPYFDIVFLYIIWTSAWVFQQCGMCDQQSLRTACAYAQSDQSLC